MWWEILRKSSLCQNAEIAPVLKITSGGSSHDNANDDFLMLFNHSDLIMSFNCLIHSCYQYLNKYFQTDALVFESDIRGVVRGKSHFQGEKWKHKTNQKVISSNTVFETLKTKNTTRCQIKPKGTSNKSTRLNPAKYNI